MAQLTSANVVGEPLRAGDVTVVPFAAIQFGVGSAEATIAVGGGMGGRVVPLGVLIVQGDEVRLEQIPELAEKPSLVREIVQAVSTYARAAYNAGLALSRVGRNAEAERMLRRAVELDPSGYDLVFALGDFLLRQGRLAEVGPLADRLAAIDPSRSEAGQLRTLAANRR